MIRRLWQRGAPWLTPAVALIEVALVGSGILTLRNAVIIVLALESLFAIIAISRVVAAVRTYRAGRGAGRDGWRAAEDALAQVVPRKAARALLIEPRLVACLVRWISGRHDGRSPDSFGYERGLRSLLAVLCGLLVVEGVVVDVLVAAFVPSGPWIWIAVGLHVYGLIWLTGFYASLVVRPHEFTPEGLRVRDGIFAELLVPYAAITAARPVHHTNFGRSGLKIAGSGAGLLAIGDATVVLLLDPRVAIPVSTRPNISLTRLAITVDDASGFLRRLRSGSRGENYSTCCVSPAAGSGADATSSTGTRRICPNSRAKKSTNVMT